MEINGNATLMNRIQTQQERFTGGLMRRHNLEHLLTTAKIERKRVREGQIEKALKSIARWLGLSKTTDIMKHLEDG